jgi:hypothetical protein
VTDVDLDIHRAGPKADEPPYRSLCLRCNVFWPCPAKSEQLQAEADEMLADRRRHSPQRMLDVSEVTAGCWLSWRGAENADFAGEPRGGVVISIDHYADPETGESLRSFNVAKEYRSHIKWDRLTQDQVGTIDPPNPKTVTDLRRAMAREMGERKTAVMTDERRMAEAIPVLLKAVA